MASPVQTEGPEQGLHPLHMPSMWWACKMGTPGLPGHPSLSAQPKAVACPLSPDLLTVTQLSPRVLSAPSACLALPWPLALSPLKRHVHLSLRLWVFGIRVFTHVIKVRISG